jgi:hypothetical protein
MHVQNLWGTYTNNINIDIKIIVTREKGSKKEN